MGSRDRRRDDSAERAVFRALAGMRDADLPHEQMLEILLQAAMSTVGVGNRGAFEELSTALAERPDLRGWRTFVARDLMIRLPFAIGQAWSRGWEPADVVRYAGRRLGPGRAALAAEAVSEQLAGYAGVTVDPRWHEQVAEFEVVPWWPAGSTAVQAHLERDGWVTFAPELLELVGFLLMLPGLERVGPPPGEYRPLAGDRPTPPPQVDERVLSRIRALLAKAEATTSEAEAEAFTAGAQERMARHSIDMAMVQAGGDQVRGERPATRRIWIDPPYEQSKTVLLNAVAQANRCRSVWTKNIGFCTVIGFAADVEAVEALFTSLLVQATMAMTRAGRIEEAGGRARSKTFRQSFLAAYAFRIGERLTEITQEQTEAARAELGDDRLLPVLASRQQDVEDRFEELFPSVTRGRSIRVGDRMGWASGRGAADQATFGTSSAVTP
ncbi:hypothetical protein Kisp02_11240 [Kineosporia sp. NBRC 101731]|nr:hypothetical protein Kisp02_11240 [Kineosporia sp. NBRC 101731]